MFMLDVSGSLNKFNVEKMTKEQVEKHLKIQALRAASSQVLKPETDTGEMPSPDDLEEKEEISMVGPVSDL